jgi:soluble lytic murein transglycosylase-like protein
MIKVDYVETEDRRPCGVILYVIASIILSVIILIVLLCGVAKADDVNMDVIKQIESSGNPLAYNRSSKARGHYQITPIVLEEFNHYKRTNYTSNDLFNPATNFLIADWYMNKRIPQMFKYFKIKDTVRNRIIAYNAGIVYARNGFAPSETRNYIKKYERALK